MFKLILYKQFVRAWYTTCDIKVIKQQFHKHSILFDLYDFK